MQKNNLIKRYFLWLAGLHPFMTPLFLGAVAGFITGFAVLRPAPRLAMNLTLGFMGLGAVVGIISSVVCRRFVSYDRDPILFFLAKDGKVILDADGKVTAGSPLWVPRGMEVIQVKLASTTHPHEIDPAPADSRNLVGLKVFFRGRFDYQEVYEKIVGVGYRDLDCLVRGKFMAAVDETPGVRPTFQHLHDRPLMELEEALEKLKKEGRFVGCKILSNIDYIQVAVNPTVVVNL